MNNITNHSKQTVKWENACIKTRRNLGKREKRLSIFKINKKQKVLDLGCGDGLNITILKKMGIRNIVGVDISGKLIKEAKRLNPNVKFYTASSEKLPFGSESFDIVLVDSVFHHLMNYEKSLLEINRVLNPKGQLCFIEPHRTLWRSLYDYISQLSISKYIPFLKERRKAYLGEKKFMKHWLATEEIFYHDLIKLNFKERLKKEDILSIIGKYEKP